MTFNCSKLNEIFDLFLHLSLPYLLLTAISRTALVAVAGERSPRPGWLELWTKYPESGAIRLLPGNLISLFIFFIGNFYNNNFYLLSV